MPNSIKIDLPDRHNNYHYIIKLWNEQIWDKICRTVHYSTAIKTTTKYLKETTKNSTAQNKTKVLIVPTPHGL